jgi:hypothetical protein
MITDLDLPPDERVCVSVREMNTLGVFQRLSEILSGPQRVRFNFTLTSISSLLTLSSHPPTASPNLGCQDIRKTVTAWAE